MKDILGVDIKPGAQIAVAGRLGSTSSHMYLATVVEVVDTGDTRSTRKRGPNGLLSGWDVVPLEKVTLRHHSNKRLVAHDSSELSGRCVVLYLGI